MSFLESWQKSKYFYSIYTVHMVKGKLSKPEYVQYNTFNLLKTTIMIHVLIWTFILKNTAESPTHTIAVS